LFLEPCMSYSKLLRNLGFEADPFAKTNADEEDRLVEYFIQPPFFPAVFGQPENPKSCFVFAPRGGGKTALKKRIEIASRETDILCVTYNSFNVAGKKLSDIDANYHLANIARLVLVAVITAVHERGIASLSKQDKHLLVLFIKENLSGVDRSLLSDAVESVKSFNEKAKDVWNTWIEPIGLAVNLLLAKLGMGAAELKKIGDAGGVAGSYMEQLRALQRIAGGIGYKSIYVLVDKVDETAITGGKASNSYEFIAPIAGDLQLLELSGYAFKFFLWDLLKDSCRTFARPDRIKHYSLVWTEQQLCGMLEKRLNAFSSGRVNSLDSIVEEGGKTAIVDDIVALFAQGSPRKLIRICKEILDQQSELSDSDDRISNDAFIEGLERISGSLASEEFEERPLRELKRNKRIDFTIRHVYHDVFKISQPAGMSKVKAWEDSGAVELLGTIKDTNGAKASNHYGVSNRLLAKHIFSDLDVFEFLSRKVRKCNGCGSSLLRDWEIIGEHHCDRCQKVVFA